MSKAEFLVLLAISLFVSADKDIIEQEIEESHKLISALNEKIKILEEYRAELLNSEVKIPVFLI